ncbi:diguanylate cyclase CdgB [Streptomyces triticirhizae]|uniref:Sensor domain-containing diguanylate cyclase n=1 Tax=Streptomyces triticirhizae TaxID=2483353 RepID=A0A3M2LY57_9ACTN|nr:diguanylate cyclase CdgB [Streptomyces triticirhizae]RMI41850.1 sensor domain-containing diguanylate cyclase [Streptomyces triticirhizae]
METETEPYVRLASLRELHQVVAQLNTARSMADTLQTVADGTVTALGFELAAVNVVRPDGDLLVAAVAGADRVEVDKAEAAIAGRTGSRASWERRLSMGERWGELRFIPYTDGWVLDHDDVPQWHTTGPAPRYPDEWHPMDRLFAPMYASDGELLAVLEVDKPRNGRRPGPWGCEALQLYASQAAIAISNARLRGNMQRALVRLEREQEALRASEESFRQAFEYAPSGMAIAEVGGDSDGRLLRVNDALCRLLGRTVAVLRRYSFADLVHPEDMGTLLRTANDGGRAELRLARKDGSYVWVSLRNSVVADPAAGPQVQLTHVEDIEERKRHELALAHRASHDSLTGLPNSAELRARLGGRICANPPESRPYPAPAPEVVGAAAFDGYGLGRPHSFDHHEHVWQPDAPGGDGKGLAVLFCDLDGFKSINDRFGHVCGDAVLVEVARRLEQGVRDNDTVARLGGDEFVVLAEGLGPKDANDLAVRLRSAIIPPIRVEGRSVRVGASFGIGWASCGMTTEEILESADQRMYIEKRSRAQGRRRAG